MSIAHIRFPGSEPIVAATAASCCPPTEQSTCCDAEDKGTCCGSAATASGGCGCQADRA